MVLRSFLLCIQMGLAGASTALQAQQASPQSTAPIAITLDEAISRSRSNEPNFADALAASRVSALDVSIAKSALLPSVVYHNQFIYTQPNGGTNQAGSTGAQAAPRFIANNSVHEYTSQGIVNETLGLKGILDVSHAAALSAVATAELEIARRGLVATVINLFHGLLAASNRVMVAQRAFDEAKNFTTLTQQRETAREAAHADVVKAELQQQQRERDLADATLQAQKARLELAVLLFPDPRTSYTLTVAASPAPLPSRVEVEDAAALRNPELQSALASLRASSLDVSSVRAAYLPDLGLNFTYGIDAQQFAARGQDNVRNLGYSASVTLDIPVWDWFSTAHRVRQSQILRAAARTTLSATQRRLIVQLDESYAEAEAAHKQIDSLALSVQAANESLRLTRLRYTEGEASVFEVVDAQNSLVATELAREDGFVRYQIALANLQLLTGTI